MGSSRYIASDLLYGAFDRIWPVFQLNIWSARRDARSHTLQESKSRLEIQLLLRTEYARPGRYMDPIHLPEILAGEYIGLREPYTIS